MAQLSVLALAFFIAIVQLGLHGNFQTGSSDIVCKKGKLSRRISVGEGDSYRFKIQASASYARNTDCLVRYKKASSCPELVFACPAFKINNKNKNCRGKDKMQIKTPRTKNSYCGVRGPEVSTTGKYLEVSFRSGRRKQNSAAVCKVKCAPKLTDVEVVRLSGETLDSWRVKRDMIDAIDLTSSSTILMRGISLFGSSSGPDTLNGMIQLKETASQKIIISEKFEFTSTGRGDYFDHVFSSPATLTALVKYTVTVEYKMDDWQQIYWGMGGLATTTAACSGETVNFEFYNSDDDNNGSWLEEGHIPRILISC